MVSRIALSTLTALLLSASVTAKVVTADNAQIVAKSFLASKGLPDSELVLLESSDESPVFRAPSIDSESPAYHIFSDKENNEIIVVAGDDIARPILGYSSNYKADENGILPPAMQDWLAEMERQISQARKSGISQSPETANQWRAASSGNVVRQLNTAKWGQNYPYNLYCPTVDGVPCITGCVATSYAILMKYYGKPSGAKGYTEPYLTTKLGLLVPSRTLTDNYDWDSMLMNYSGNFNYSQAEEVALLMADLGAAIRADYGLNETTASYGGGYIFKHFGFHLGTRSYKSSYTDQQWYTMMKEQLDNNRPILYNAKLTDDSGAHSFIIDGYTDQNYFCVNWGWNGNCDGAYSLDALTPNNTYDYGGPQSAFFEFQPAAGLPAVAKVDDTAEYPSLEAALAMVPSDGKPAKITLLENNDISDVYVMRDQNIVLDLNGKKVGVVAYGICNRGDLIIADSKGNGSIVVRLGNTGIISNYGNLTVYGGEFVNQEGAEIATYHYNRCIWSDRGTSTYIKSGRFKSIGSVICSNGSLRIDNGEFTCLGNEAVIANYNVGDTVYINGGTFQNMTNAAEGETNYRRAIWTCNGSITHITGGVFNSKNPALVSNGECIIDNGRFETTGNTSTVYNYSTTAKMTINGGIFVNSLGLKEPKDYRRAFYSLAETETYFNGGKFTSPYQVITVVGKAVFNDATIENTGEGLGILAGGSGNVTVNYSKIKAKEVLHNNDSYLKCFGGLYSSLVSNSLLGTGCQCVSNDDDATASIYRYKVVNPAGVDNIIKSTDSEDMHYDLNGRTVPDNNPGIHIIRTSDGKTVKVLYR